MQTPKEWIEEAYLRYLKKSDETKDG